MYPDVSGCNIISPFGIIFTDDDKNIKISNKLATKKYKTLTNWK